MIDVVILSQSFSQMDCLDWDHGYRPSRMGVQMRPFSQPTMPYPLPRQEQVAYRFELGYVMIGSRLSYDVLHIQAWWTRTQRPWSRMQRMVINALDIPLCMESYLMYSYYI